MAPLVGSDLCFTHSPESQAERDRARQRGGEATSAVRYFDVPAEPDRLRAVEAVQSLIERTIHETRTQANDAGRSRAIFAGLRLALLALAAGDWEARLAALEERFGQLDPRAARRQLSSA